MNKKSPADKSESTLPAGLKRRKREMRKLSFAVARKDKFSLRIILKVLLPFERLDYIILSPKNFKKFLSGTKKILSGKNFRFLPPRTEIYFK